MTFINQGRVPAGKIIALLCLLCLTVILAACDSLFGDSSTSKKNYTFENKTNTTIYVIFDQKYSIWNGSSYSYYEKDDKLSIYKDDKKTVEIEKDSVDFKYEVYGSTGEDEVYTEINGSTAVFKTRKITGYYKYEFVNQTTTVYSIEVTLNKPYKTALDRETTTNTLTVYRTEPRTVYLYLGNSLDFEWTAGSVSNNEKTYTEISGSKVTFKER